MNSMNYIYHCSENITRKHTRRQCIRYPIKSWTVKFDVTGNRWAVMKGLWLLWQEKDIASVPLNNFLRLKGVLPVCVIKLWWMRRNCKQCLPRRNINEAHFWAWFSRMALTDLSSILWSIHSWRWVTGKTKDHKLGLLGWIHYGWSGWLKCLWKSESEVKLVSVQS